MSKWLALLFVIGMITGGWWLTRTYARVVPPWKMAKYGVVTRGDIRVPISAPGLIEPFQRIEIKSKADGEVIEVLVREGDFVNRGQVLVVLKRDDEERARDRAQSALSRARVGLEQARLAVLTATQNLAVAEGQKAEAEARLISTEATYYNVKDLFDKQLGESEFSLRQAESNYKVNLAQIEQLTEQIDIRRLGIEDARQMVEAQEANVAEAEKLVEDAVERLSETEIRAPLDALVTDVMVRIGTIVQSGTGGFTGGTPVLTLADISEYKVIARVDEADYGKVYDISPTDSLPQVGQLGRAEEETAEEIAERSGVVRLYVDAYPEDEFVGRIDRVAPQGRQPVGSTTIQYDVHILITDENRWKLPLGAQAQVEFTVESVKDVLRVPAEAVKSEDEIRGVYVEADEPTRPGHVARRFIRCRFGITDGEYTHVISSDEPLSVDQKVFTKLPPDED